LKLNDWQNNSFERHFKTHDRLLKVINTIIDRHGRVTDIELYDKDPTVTNEAIKFEDHTITL
jgi:hypothetical protein